MAGLVPKEGHDAVLAIESSDAAGGVTSAGTFTQVAFVNVGFIQKETRAVTNVTPRKATAPTYLVNPAKEYDQITLKGPFAYAHATHDDSTGLEAHWNSNGLFGLMLQGPEWAAGVDEIIHSGQLVSFSRIYNEGENAYEFEAVFQPTGVVKREGTLVGSVT